MKLPQRSKADDPTQGQTPPNDSLALHPPLPSLLTDCVIVGHAEKADVVFTPPQWFAMCAHMMNDNPDNFFLMPYFWKKGQARSNIR